MTVGPARNIRDSHRGDHVIDFRRAVASSSNVYFAKAIWDRYGITGKKQEYSDFLHENSTWARPSGWNGSANAPRRSLPTGKYPTRASCSSR